MRWQLEIDPLRIELPFGFAGFGLGGLPPFRPPAGDGPPTPKPQSPPTPPKATPTPRAVAPNLPPSMQGVSLGCTF
ncbi:hypothetical protein ABTK99_20095, partial [Acinetobacter baumannii]